MGRERVLDEIRDGQRFILVTHEKSFGPGHNGTQEGVALMPFGGEFGGAVDNRVDLAFQLSLWLQERGRHSSKGGRANDENVQVAPSSWLTPGEGSEQKGNANPRDERQQRMFALDRHIEAAPGAVRSRKAVEDQPIRIGGQPRVGVQE